MTFGNNFTYDATVPVTTNYPGKDQPVMQTNTGSISQLINNDHVTFNAANGGTHTQLSFASQKVLGYASPATSQCAVYPAPGTASTESNCILQNPNGNFLMSALRGFVCFTNSTTPSIANGFNCLSITTTGINPPVYVVTFKTGSIQNSPACVLITTASNNTAVTPFNYTLVGPVLTLSYFSPFAFSTTAAINIAILQA